MRELLGDDKVTVICEVDNSYVCVCVGFNSYISAACIVF